MERVGSAVCVYDCDFDYGAHGYDVGITVFAVDLGVIDEVGWSGEGCVEGWNLGIRC